MAESTARQTVISTPSDLELAAERLFDAPRRLIWEAWTNPEHIPHWMLGPEGWTMPVCEVDLRVGGGWRFVWRMADGTEMEMTGEYREIIPPELLVSTESWGPEWPETVNTLVLIELEENLTKSINTVKYPSRAARDQAMETGMEEGWSQSNERLAEYLSTLL